MHVSDIRGHGLFWAIEYAGAPTTLAPRFATRVHLEALKLGLVTFGLPGTTDGVEGECVMIAPVSRRSFSISLSPALSPLGQF